MEMEEGASEKKNQSGVNRHILRNLSSFAQYAFFEIVNRTRVKDGPKHIAAVGRQGRQASRFALVAGKRKHVGHVSRLVGAVHGLVEKRLRGVPKQQLEEFLGPHHAVDRFVGGAANGANGVDFLGGLGLALVARGLPLRNHERLAVEARSARFDQGLGGGQAQAVHVPPRVNVVERVEHAGKLLEILQPKLLVLVRFKRSNSKSNLKRVKR